MSDPYNHTSKKTSYTYDQLARIRRGLIKENAEIRQRLRDLEQAAREVVNSRGGIEYLVALENLEALLKVGAGNE